MAAYRVLVKPSAEKEIEAFEPKKARRRVVAMIRALGADPRPPGSVKLSGSDDRYRLRLGSHRIVYSLNDQERTVMIVKVGHRREVYR